MTEDRFWEIVDTVNWASDCNYNRIKNWMLNNLTPEEIDEFSKIKSEKVNLLDKMIGRRNPSGGGDDSYSDLLNHVVGLGKEQFEAHLTDYSLLEARGKAPYDSPEGYTESFAYCIPYDDDLKNHNDPKYFKNWAKKAIQDIDNMLEMDKKDDLRDIVKDFQYVRQRLRLVEAGKYEAFLSVKKEILKALDKIRKFFEVNYSDLPRKFTDNGFHGYNEWSVKNLVTDLEDKVKYSLTSN